MEFRRIENMMDRYGAEVVAEMLVRLNHSNKDSSGNLKRNLKFTLKKGSTVLELDIEAPEYWEYVDKGRKPGKFAPVGDLQKWARINGIPESAVYPINLKIKRKGIPATNFASLTISRSKSKFEEMVQKAYREDVDDFITEMVQQLNTN
jgi:hypothetical protein